MSILLIWYSKLVLVLFLDYGTLKMHLWRFINIYFKRVSCTGGKF